MAAVTCPTLENILNGEQCLENLPGLSDMVYCGIKSELAAPLTATGNRYATPTFKSGKGLYKFECASETQGIVGESLGLRAGYKQTLEFAFDGANEVMARAARALNNLDIFFIVPDGEDFQIMYDKNRRCKSPSGGIKTDTGKAGGDTRQTTCQFELQPVYFPNYYVTIENIDELLAGASSGA